MSKRGKFIFLLILILCGFTRLYKLPATFSLSSDLVQPFVIAEKIIKDHQFILLGYGPTQINIVAPTYHLLVTVLFYFLRNEFLVTLFIVFVSVISVLIVFFLTRKISNAKAALLASLLYATSFELTLRSRDLPHPMVSFFLLLSLYLLFAAIYKNRAKFMISSFFFFLLALMYISSYLFVPAYSFIFLAAMYKMSISHGKKTYLILSAIILLFAIFYFPVFYYHYLNNFKELAAIPSLVTAGDNFFQLNLYSVLTSMVRHTDGIVQGLFQIPNEFFSTLLFIFTLAIMVATIVRSYISSQNLLIIGLFVITGLILTGINPGQVYLHRIIVFFPLFIIIYSAMLIKLTEFFHSKILLAAVFIVSMTYFFYNQKSLGTMIAPENRQADHQQKVAEFVKNIVSNKTFSIITINPDDQSGYYSLEYIYALKKMPLYQIPINMDLRGELFYEFDPQKDYLFLICNDFRDAIEVEHKCFDVFQKKYGLSKYLLQKKIDNSEIFVFETGSLPTFGEEPDEKYFQNLDLSVYLTESTKHKIPPPQKPSTKKDKLNRYLFDQYFNGTFPAPKTPALIAQGPLLLRTDTREIVQLKGVTSQAFNYYNYALKDLMDRLNLVRKWGINVVGLYLTENNTNKNIQKLDAIIDWAKDNGVYVYLMPHAGDFSGNFVTKVRSFQEFMKSLANRYLNQTHILYGLWAEPRSLTWEDWRPEAVAIAEKIRSVNPQAPIIMTGLEYGRNFKDIGKKPLPFLNVLYDFHDYPWADVNDAKKRPDAISQGFLWDQMAGKYPVLVGEFGGLWADDFSSDSDLEYMQKVIDDVNKRGLHYTVYTIDPEGGLSVLDNKGEKPSRKGQLFINDLFEHPPSFLK